MPRYFMHKAFVVSERRDHHIVVSMRARYPLRFLEGFLCLGIWYLLITLNASLVATRNLEPTRTLTWILSTVFGPPMALALTGLHVAPILQNPIKVSTCMVVELVADAITFCLWMGDVIALGVGMGGACTAVDGRMPTGCERCVALLAFVTVVAFVWMLSISVDVFTWFKTFHWDVDEMREIESAETMGTLRRLAKGGKLGEVGNIGKSGGGRSRTGSEVALVVRGVAGKCTITRSRAGSVDVLGGGGEGNSQSSINNKRARSASTSIDALQGESKPVMKAASINMPNFERVGLKSATGSRMGSAERLLQNAGAVGTSSPLAGRRSRGRAGSFAPGDGSNSFAVKTISASIPRVNSSGSLSQKAAHNNLLGAGAKSSLPRVNSMSSRKGWSPG